MSEAAVNETAVLKGKEANVAEVAKAHHELSDRDAEGTVHIRHNSDQVALMLEAAGTTMQQVKDIHKSLSAVIVGATYTNGEIAADVFSKDPEAQSVRTVFEDGHGKNTINTMRTADVRQPPRTAGEESTYKTVPGRQSVNIKVQAPKTALKRVGEATSYRVAALSD